MALPVDLLLTRTELPQDGARLNPAHPLAGRFVTAYLPGVSSDNLGFGGPGGITGNAHSRSAIPAGPTLRLSGSGANATTSRSFGPTPSYPLTMVVVCRQSNNTTSTIAALTSASPPGGSYWYFGGGSSTILTFGARNAFGTALSLNVTVPADANGNQAIGQDMVIVLQSLSASDHRICVNSSAVATATTNIGSMSAWDRLILGQTSGTTGLDVAAVLFAHGGTALTDAQMRQIASHPREVWELFEPQRLQVLVPSASGVSGTSATTNANDTSSASGTTTVTGTSATTNAADTSSASGTTTVVGTSATTNANDTSSASGTVGSGSVTGTSATTNANDTSSASGTTTVVGTSATTNANDSVSAAGWAGVVSGTSATTNANDTASASGTGSQDELRGRVVRRRKTKTPLPAAEEVIESPAVTQSLISSDAMKLLVEKAGDNARQAVKVARVKAEKRRIEIQKAEEAAIEKALFEWF